MRNIAEQNTVIQLSLLVFPDADVRMLTTLFMPVYKRYFLYIPTPLKQGESWLLYTIYFQDEYH